MRTSKADFERALARHERVTLTLDDGFAANIDYVVETTERREIPLIIFLTTGFINRTVEPYELQIAKILGATDQARYESLRLPLKTKSVEARSRAVRQLAAEHGVPEPKLADELYLTWDQIRELDAHPLVEFGAHTVNHVVLSRLAPRRAWREIRESKREIETRLGHAITAFAYPYGHTSALVTPQVRLAGFERAFVTDHGGESRFRIGRVDLNHGS